MSAATLAVLTLGCQEAKPPVRGFSVPEAERPYLPSPLETLPIALPQAEAERIGAAWEALMAAGDLNAAAAVAAEVVAADPAQPAGQVLLAQVESLRLELEPARNRVAGVAAAHPGYVPAWLLLGRTSELLGDIPEAYRAFREITPRSPFAGQHAAELRSRAVEIVVTRFHTALKAGRTPTAEAALDLLRRWAVDEELRLGLERELAAARGDQVAELAAVRGLSRRHPEDKALMERRAELEVEVGDAGEGLRLLQALQRERPNDAQLAQKLDRAEFAWRVQLLPREIRDLASSPVLSRGDLAALIYWLVPDVRRRSGGMASGRIASDVLDHPQREAIVRVVNLGLLDVDETLHRFGPERPARRAETLEALLRVLAAASPPSACVASLTLGPNPSADLVCRAAAGCGLLAEAAGCLPFAGVAGQDAVDWIRRTVEAPAPR